MDFIKRTAGAATLELLFGAGLLASPAQAQFVLTFAEVGSDVVATGSGSIDLTGLTYYFSGDGYLQASIWPASGIAMNGPPSSATTYYGPMTGPTNFGSGGAKIGYSGANGGNIIALYSGGSSSMLAVPINYVSGTPLSNNATYYGQTFSTLGLTPDSYSWSWGNGAGQNFSIQYAVQLHPQPAPR